MKEKLREFADAVKAEANEMQVTQDHKPTKNELDNLTYLVMKYTAGWGMRACDLAVITMMAGEITSMQELDEKFIPVLAEYVWDHIMGEPSEIDTEDLEYATRAFRDSLFGQDEATRNSV